MAGRNFFSLATNHDVFLKAIVEKESFFFLFFVFFLEWGRDNNWWISSLREFLIMREKDESDATEQRTRPFL